MRDKMSCGFAERHNAHNQGRPADDDDERRSPPSSPRGPPAFGASIGRGGHQEVISGLGEYPFGSNVSPPHSSARPTPHNGKGPKGMSELGKRESYRKNSHASICPKVFFFFAKSLNNMTRSSSKFSMVSRLQQSRALGVCPQCTSGKLSEAQWIAVLLHESEVRGSVPVSCCVFAFEQIGWNLKGPYVHTSFRRFLHIFSVVCWGR